MTSTSLKNKSSSEIRKRKKVFVGLSGGVDSAVSAALLKDQGFDVTGVFIKVWQPDWLPCTWREERRDAMRVAIALDIPFLFLDLSDEYKKGVVDKVVSEYKAGRTPNPDVLCNKEIKFGAFWKKAEALGADFIATGHYARIEDGKLLEGKDKEKDQSYFLWTLTDFDLEHTLFPVGAFLKDEVRKLAKKFNIPVAEKKDSQGICFLGDVDMEDFLSHFIKTKRGDVLDTDGAVIGRHRGALHYTIGERHGFEITDKTPDDKPFYVVAKDMKANTITVSNKKSEIDNLAPKKILIKETNWIREPEGPDLTARIRYRDEKLPIYLGLDLPAGRQGRERLFVEFRAPERGVSLGQSVVFYDGETCLGGGVMDKTLE